MDLEFGFVGKSAKGLFIPQHLDQTRMWRFSTVSSL